MIGLRGLMVGGPAVALVILGLGCACSDSPSRQLEVYVDSSQCGLPPHCAGRFEVFVLRGSCVYAWATKTGTGGQLDLEPLDLEEGTVQVLATCGTESCVRCWGSGRFAAERRVDLALQPVVACTVPKAVTSPCTECGPTEGTYCDGDRRVSCVDGEVRIETCPEGCAAGACGVCTKTTYYKDIDGDTYGDPNASLEACLPPSGYVTGDTDCDDGDRDAHPTQTAFFTEPTLTAQNFDYDCNKVEEQEDTEKERSCVFFTSSRICSGGGWRGAVPACGQSGTMVTCKRTFEFFCIPATATLKQACR